MAGVQYRLLFHNDIGVFMDHLSVVFEVSYIISAVSSTTCFRLDWVGLNIETTQVGWLSADTQVNIGLMSIT